MTTDSAYQIVGDLADLDPVSGGKCALCGARPPLRRPGLVQEKLSRPLAHYPRCPWARAVEHERSR